jgi:hypothetical protein
VAKYLVVKKVVSEESWCLLVESERTLEELKLLEDDGLMEVFDGVEFQPQYDTIDTKTYEVRFADPNERFHEFGQPECWDDFDQDEEVADHLTYLKEREVG